MSGFLWDKAARIYKTARGKAVPSNVITDLRNAIADATKQEASDLTAAFFMRAATLTNWAERFAALIKDSTIAGYLLGAGGANALTPADDARIAAVLGPQLDAAKDFTSVLANASKPILDDTGMPIDPTTLTVDEHGAVVDEAGDPVFVDGQPLMESDLAEIESAWSDITGALARAGSYESGVIAGYSAGQAASWDVNIPDTPPAHANCRCTAFYDQDGDGQVLFTWLTAGDEQVCPICDGLESQYQQWPTGTYASLGEGEG